MISVLIPVFNTHIGPLVTALLNQLAAIKENVEVVVMDDCSDNEASKNANRAVLAGCNNVRYIELSANAGRNIIRHRLAGVATYNTLIFIDADSSFPDELWLQRYLVAHCGNAVIMGGRVYKKLPSAAASLHWKYGSAREQQAALLRNQHPWRSFLACNFMATKEQLSHLIIDPHLQGYCHEDTFMGLQFKQLGITVKHIDNPVYHDGVDDDTAFIKKQKEALVNLLYLYRTYNNMYHLSTEIKLIRIYETIARNAAGKYVLNKLKKGETFFKQHALSSYNLFWLDCWKLAVFHTLCCNTG